MALRPAMATWFELLIARDQLTVAAACHGDGGVLRQFATLGARLRTYRPQGEGHRKCTDAGNRGYHQDH
jgi:hypothetical protein